jgi:glutathione S-transferase
MLLTLYGRHTSYNVQKVLWLLDELELEYRHIETGSIPGDTETDEFGRLNPMRKVPVLVDDEKTVWESNTILRYLVNSYGRGSWEPGDAYQRSSVERWMDWSQSQFQPAFNDVFWGYYRTPEPLRNMDLVNSNLVICQECFGQLDDLLDSKKYLLGDELSLADITTGVFLYRLLEIGLNVQLPARVSTWYERLQTLAGYQKRVMSDFSSLFARLEY